MKIGIVTVSDRASAGIYQDLSGPAIEDYLKEVISSPWHAVRSIVADGVIVVRERIIELSDKQQCAVIFTTGGTGPSVRDETTEATEAACTKLLPGFGELMRSISLREVPTAILSRQTAGIRNSTLIVNLPGRPASIRTCLNAIFPAIPYCLDLIGRPGLQTNPLMCKSFRPDKK